VSFGTLEVSTTGLVCGMPTIKKILLPVDFPNTSLDVIHQAAALARHFHSEIVILHVAPSVRRAARSMQNVPSAADWDALTENFRSSRTDRAQSLGPELGGLSVRHVSASGGAARAIVQTAQQENADLIMMPSHGHTFCHFLLSSVAGNVLNKTGCPVWTGGYNQSSPVQNFSVRNVLCAIDFNGRERDAVSWAARLATATGASLTIAHVTTGLRYWGPGGTYTDPRWKEALVRDASQRIADLRNDMGVEADVFIGSGHVPTVLSQAANQTKADVLVTGSYPYAGHMRTHGYSTIRAMPIPVMSV
jgi:nucleotide-binding universal stress UspA family protein